MTVPAMSSNGQGQGHGRGHGPRVERGAAALASGRVFVTTAIVVILVIAGVLGLAFRSWKAQYLARVAHGDARVVKAVEPLADPALTPPEVPANDWREALAETRSMLEAVVRSNLLDVPQLDDFGARLAAQVAAARDGSETARDTLGAIWDDVENGPGFVREVVARRKHFRPACLPPRKLPGAAVPFPDGARQGTLAPMG